MITVDEAVKEGMEVVKICAQKFWTSNREAYLKFSHDDCDMVGYLNLTILVKRYLPTVEKRPDFYATIENFKASLYTSCWKACLAHYRLVKAQKRRDAFRPGALVYLNQPIEGGEESSLPVIENEMSEAPVESMDDFVKNTADTLLEEHGCLASRMFLLMAAKGTPQSTLPSSFPRTIKGDRLAELSAIIKKKLKAH